MEVGGEFRKSKNESEEALGETIAKYSNSRYTVYKKLHYQ